MKYLFYTISDLNPISLACTDILYKSLKNKITNLNFQIIVPKKYSDQNITNNLIKYVESDYLSITRYNKEIFEQDYDYFIYLDSDIYFNLNQDMFFYEISNNDIICCGENQSIKYSVWHHIMMDNDFLKKYIDKIAVNSGFFCLNKYAATNLSDYFSNYFKDIYNIPNYKKLDKSYVREKLNSNTIKPATNEEKLKLKNKKIEFMSEQSLFNKFLIQNQNKYKIKDFSDKIEINKYWLYGQDFHFEKIGDKIYHFCGHFNIDMNKKLTLMNDFFKKHHV